MGSDERTGEQFMRAIKFDDQADGPEIDQGDGMKSSLFLALA